MFFWTKCNIQTKISVVILKSLFWFYKLMTKTAHVIKMKSMNSLGGLWSKSGYNSVCGLVPSLS